MSIDYTSYSDDFDNTINSETINDTDSNDKVLMGSVANCNRVYVRSEADKDSDPLTDLIEGSELLISGTFDDDLGNGWYQVCTASGIDGYIMSKFVKLND